MEQTTQQDVLGSVLSLATRKFDEYSGKISALEIEVSEKQDRINSLEADSTEKEATISKLRDQKNKKQRRIHFLEKQVDTKRQKLTEIKHCICNRRLEANSPPPFSTVHRTKQDEFMNLVHRYVTAGAQDVESEWQCFISKAITFGPKSTATNTLIKVLENRKVVQMLTKKIKKSKKKSSQSHSNRALDYIIRKKLMLGRLKKENLTNALGSINVPICDGLEISPLKLKPNSYGDAKARSHVRKVFQAAEVIQQVYTEQEVEQTMEGKENNDGDEAENENDVNTNREFLRQSAASGGLPSAVNNPEIEAEHAILSLKDLIAGILTMVFTTRSLHSHFYWFLNNESLEVEDDLLYFGIFLDGFPLFRDSGATQSSLVLANLPIMMQMPDFHFMNFLIKKSENSSETWCLIRDVEKEAALLEEEGLILKFSGYPDSWSLPKSTTPLNSNHHFRIKFFGKGDAKMKLQLHGSLSANMRFPAPEIGWSVEKLGYPDSKISEENMRTFEDKLQSFNDMKKKREALVSEYEKAKERIMLNLRMKNKEKNDKVDKLQKKLTKDLNSEAAKLKTCIIHESPVKFAHLFPPCLLHFSCNAWGRVLKAIDVYVRRFTLKHQLHDQDGGVFYRKATGNSYHAVPNFAKCNENSPLVAFVLTLQKSGLSVYAKFLIDSYSHDESPLAKTQPEDNTRERKKIPRMGGEQEQKTILNLPALIKSIQPPAGILESNTEKADRIVLAGYAHVIKCACALFAQFTVEVETDITGASFLGQLLCSLIYTFDLHFSLNTFLMTKLAPFYMKKMSNLLRITPELALGLGSYGNSQGGEHKNKFAKAAAKTWVSGRPGSFLELLDQMVEIFIGAPAVFPQLLPADMDCITDNVRGVWGKHFGQEDATRCSCCGDDHCAVLEPLSVILDSFDEERKFSFAEIKACLESTYFEEEPRLSLQYLMEKYLRVNLSHMFCLICAEVVLVLCALLTNCEHELSFVDIDYVFKKDNDVSDSDASDAESSDED